MKSAFLSTLIFTMITMVAADQGRAGQLLYLASTKEKSVTAYQVDAATGRLTKQFSVDLPGNAGPLAFSPESSFVYAAVTGLADGKAGVVTLKHAADGSLTPLATATIKSRAPYIRADKSGRILLAAHYGEGAVSTYRIKQGICTAEMLDHKVTEKTAHCIELDPSGKYAFVPHTSPNKVYQFRLNAESGELIPNEPPFVEGPDTDHLYHQPRHYAHHPNISLAYTSNERGGGITAWKFDEQTGTLTKAQTLSTLPPEYSGQSAAADIKITPNGKFAYVSNRDLTKAAGSPTQDTLAAVELNPKTGRMKIVGHYAAPHFPRSICIDLTGNYLFAAGQLADAMLAYRIDQKTGALQKLAEYKTGGVPIWIMCGNVD